MILVPLTIIPLLFLGHGVVAIVIVHTLINIIYLFATMAYSKSMLKTKIILTRIKAENFKEIIGFSFYVFLNAVVDKIYWSTDQIILGIITNTSIVAIYAIAMQFIMIYIHFSTAISGVLLPRISIIVAENSGNRKITELFTKIGRLQFIALSFMLIGFILYGRQFIIFWAGYNYISSYYITLIVMIPITIPLIQNTGISILQAMNKHAFRSIVYLIISVINIAASIPMAIRFGGYGAALVTGLAQLLGNMIIINIYYYKVIGIDIFYFFKSIIQLLYPIIIVTFLMIILNYLLVSNNIIVYITKLFIFTVLYAIIVFKLGMNKFEKNIIMSLLKRSILESVGEKH